MIGALVGILAIVVFVTIHEAGHFLAAKATGMKATEFFFGFGPRLWSVKRGETEYGIKAIPAGGYVRIVGMNPFEEVAPEDRGRTYREKPFWQKSFVVLAGVGANFLLAFLMFYGLVLAVGIPEPVPVVNAVIETVDGEPTAAAVAGIRPGDRILGVDGVRYDDWSEISALLAARPGETVTLTVERAGSVLEVPVTLGTRPGGDRQGERGFLGVQATVVERPAGLLEAGVIAGGEVAAGVRLTFEVMGRLIQPESLLRLAGVFIGQTDIPDEIRPVSPIGLAQIGSQAGAIGIANYIGILASINVILATFNVLPLLPLDGGHFAVALWQKVTGREPDIRRLVPVAVAVIVLFVFLGLVAVVLDIFNPIRI
jgi:membrane-associated protease RseP (regulator of RpoE activity)